MKSDKIIIELKDLFKVYQMGEENIVKALDISTVAICIHTIRTSLSKVLHALILYLAVAK